MGVKVIRMLQCPACKLYGWNDSEIEHTYEVNTCRSCNNIWKLDYSSSAKLYDNIVNTYIFFIRTSAEEAIAHITQHQWSVNLGKKDKQKLQLIEMLLRHILDLTHSITGDKL